MIRGRRRVPADIRARFARLVEHFGDDRRVVALYLFGSYAHGAEGPLSDVDIAVLLHAPGEDDGGRLGLDLLGEVNRLLGTDEVSFVVLNEAPLTLRYEVVRTGKVLVDNDRSARLRFETHTEDLYLDFKPFLEAYDEALLRQLAGPGT
jgi:predicted nucleotidyltransferase